MQRVSSLVFYILWELLVQIFNNHEDKAKRSLPTFVSKSLKCPISNVVFPSQSAPKVFLDLNKDIICIMELYSLNIIGRKSTRSSLEAKTHTLYFWNNYSKVVLKNYIGVLQYDLSYCAWILWKYLKNSLK